jgi:beta-lactam-binding protein with PASTA domain
MPKLVGFDNVSAMQLLSRAGFDPANVLMLRAPSSRADFGKVVKTDPPAGRVVPNNAIVKVYLGSGSSGG